MPTDTTLRDYLIDEFVEDYVERHLTRREALRRIAAITGSLTAASAILAACTPAPTPAAQPSATAAPPTATSVPPTATATSAPAAAATPQGPTVSASDPAIKAAAVEFAGPAGKLMGYLASPQGAGPFPGVLVCHENRGLTEHINDVTRRLAKAGYVGLAVDLLSREGGTAAIKAPAQIPGALANAAPERFIEDFQAGMKYLQEQPNVRRDRIGMVGYCFGGGIAWRVATKTPELRAVVPFYGPAPQVQDVPGIQAAVLALYGGLDQRINASIPTMEAAMKEHGKTFETVVYEGANHAFHNDTGANYNATAARAAWARTLAWFDKYLKTVMHSSFR